MQGDDQQRDEGSKRAAGEVNVVWILAGVMVFVLIAVLAWGLCRGAALGDEQEVYDDTDE